MKIAYRTRVEYEPCADRTHTPTVRDEKKKERKEISRKAVSLTAAHPIIVSAGSDHNSYIVRETVSIFAGAEYNIIIRTRLRRKAGRASSNGTHVASDISRINLQQALAWKV